MVVKNLDELVQVCDSGQLFKAGKEQDELALMRRRGDGCGCFIAVDDDGRIHSLGFDDQLPDYDCVSLDGAGCSLIPGLVDSHTHPVWAGDRLFEFEMKMSGASYLDIHEKGGGIYFTVEQTRAASEQQLSSLLTQRLDQCLAHGTTLLEAKTGYGLDLETERKLLRVIASAQRQHEVDLVTTLLAGHAVPRGMSAHDAVHHVISLTAQLKDCGDVGRVDFVDVFCEKGVFDADQSRRILESGRDVLGAAIAFHGDELSCSSSAELAAQLRAKSVSHCEYISQQGMQAIAASQTVAILCPTTAFLLRLDAPPARSMIAAGVVVAVATDFNPNAYCLSLAYAMQVAVVYCRLSLNEALVGATINAAFALDRSQMYGSLEPGKWGDMVLLNSSDWRQWIYQMGQSQRMVKSVIKRGRVVHMET